LRIPSLEAIQRKTAAEHARRASPAASTTAEESHPVAAAPPPTPPAIAPEEEDTHRNAASAEAPAWASANALPDTDELSAVLIPSLEDAPVRGYRPEPERRWTCLFLGISLALLGALGAAPAVMEIGDYLRSDQTLPVARWAWLAILAAVVQVAYAVYAMQLPDWSTAWVATLAGAGLAAAYAFLLGLTWWEGADSRVVALLELQDHLVEGRAPRWCFVMMGLLGVYAYFAGRAALHWRHAFHLTRTIRGQRSRASAQSGERGA
jgi:hypothetical protein